MKHLAVILTLLLITPLLVPASSKTHVSFEATITRIEPWGLVRLSCGTYINYRLATYRIDFVYDGKFTKGQVVTLKHLACNYNELDDLKVGDKVLVVAELLARQEKLKWNEGAGKAGERVSVSHRGLSIGKLVYPTADSPR